MMRVILITILVLAGIASPVRAQNMLMARSELSFDDSMRVLKASIVERGYEIAHVQRCDGGLRGFGYETDLYRVVFFGKFEEVRELSGKYPELVAFLPLKIALFAEGEQTIISVINPSQFSEYYPDRDLQIQFGRWENDLRSILADVQKATPLQGDS